MHDRRADLDRRSGPDFHDPFGDDALAGLQPILNDPALLDFAAKGDGPDLGLVLTVHRIDKRALWTLRDRRVRNDDAARGLGRLAI